MEFKELDGFKTELKEYHYFKSVESQKIKELNGKMNELRTIRKSHEKNIFRIVTSFRRLVGKHIEENHGINRRGIILIIGKNKVEFRRANEQTTMAKD